MNDLLYDVWLCNLKNIGYDTIIRLYNKFKSSKAIYDADLKELSEKDAAILKDKSTALADEILSACEKTGVRIICCFDKRYPKLLSNIQKPPKLLYVRGCDMDFNDMVTVTIVGSRNPSPYGSRMAFKFGHDLAKEGVTIVSGMARGIDSISQRGALKAGGKTIAVLGTGCDIVYPPENKELKSIIENNGCVISEYPPGTRATRGSFPERNRIMSGLAMGVVVIEGAAGSGTGITSRLATQQGRELYCLPGNVDNPFSYIPNSYIKDGCPAVTCAADIIVGITSMYPELMLEKVLTDKTEEVTIASADRLTMEQRKIVKVLSKNTPTHIEEICFKTSLDVAVVNQNILLLEISGVVASMPGRNYILK